MGTSNYSDEFKRDAVHQITVRGYAVREVSRRLGVSTHSLYKWLKLFAAPASKACGVDHEAENRRLKTKIGSLVMDNDLLYDKIDRLEDGVPFHLRTSKS